MLSRFLIVWLVASSAIAFWWPDIAAEFVYWWPGGWAWCPFKQGDPFLVTKPYLPHLIVVTMFAIGLMLPKREVNDVAKNWPSVLGGTVIQYLTMPLLAYLVCQVMGLTGELRLGVMIVGCVPGAMASNVLTLAAKGNPSYSVSLTTSATLLSPLVVPVCFALVRNEWEAETVHRMLTDAGFMLLTVVLPVTVGHLVGRLYLQWEDEFKELGPVLANLSILWIIAVVVAGNRTLPSASSTNILFGLLAINLGGYTAGFLGGAILRLKDRSRRALTLEVGMQNAGLGAVIATTLFQSSVAAVPPAIYTFLCMLTGTLLATIWAAIPPRES